MKANKTKKLISVLELLLNENQLDKDKSDALQYAIELIKYQKKTETGANSNCSNHEKAQLR